MPRLSTFALLSGFLLAQGCGPSANYGEPQQPTGSQMQAINSLTQVSSKITVASKGRSNANEAFGVQGLMAQLQGTAINQASSTGALGLDTLGIDESCTSGTPATGFQYNNCTTETGTISGSVKITPTSVAYDLHITAQASGTKTDLSLVGTVNASGGRVSGDLEYKIHIDLGALGGLGGLGGVSNTDTVTKAVFDIGYTEEPSCITDGTIEVSVDYAGQFRAAKFTFAGCNNVTVQNGS